MARKEIESNSYLSFKLAEEVFAAHVSKVLNILEMTKITKVPRAPEYMKGVINLRGDVLPVVDTRIKFGLPETEQTANTCIIVMDLEMDGNSLQVGALVDGVQEVFDLSPDDIQPPPSIGTKYRSEFIQGMGKSGDSFIMILDVDKVFSTDEVVNLREATTEAELNA